MEHSIVTYKDFFLSFSLESSDTFVSIGHKTTLLELYFNSVHNSTNYSQFVLENRFFMSDGTTDFSLMLLVTLHYVYPDLHRLKAESLVLRVHTSFLNQPRTPVGPVPRTETQDIR